MVGSCLCGIVNVCVEVITFSVGVLGVGSVSLKFFFCLLIVLVFVWVFCLFENGFSCFLCVFFCFSLFFVLIY